MTPRRSGAVSSVYRDSVRPLLARCLRTLHQRTILVLTVLLSVGIAGTLWYVSRLPVDRAAAAAQGGLRGLFIFMVAGAGLGLVAVALVMSRLRRNATQLEIRERKFRSLFDAAPDAMIIVDQYGKIALVNDFAQTLFGYTAQELQRQPIELLVPERFRRAHREHCAGYVAAPRNRHMNAAGDLAVRKDGTEFPVEIGLNPVHTEEGVLISSVVRDMAEAKRAETALREAESKYRALVEQSLLGVYIIQDGRFVYVNPKLAQIFGYSREELLALPTVFHLIESADHELVTEQLRRRLDGEVKEVVYEFRARRKGGAAIHLEAFGGGTEYKGRPAIIGTLLDITERTQSENALAKSEKQYRDLVETSNDVIWSVDTEGCWTFLNRQAAKCIWGYEIEEMLGRPFTAFETAEQAAKDLEAFGRVKAGEPHVQYETVQLRKDGSPVHLSVNAVVLRDATGSAIGATGTATDITTRKRLESQLIQSKELESTAQLAGGPAHDFTITQPAPTPPRRYVRARVSVDAEVSVNHAGRTIRVDGRLTTLGEGGAFVELSENCAVGSLLRLRFTTPELGEIACQAIVRSGVKGEGIGVEFQDIEPRDRERIKAFVEKARRSATPD